MILAVVRNLFPSERSMVQGTAIATCNNPDLSHLQALPEV